MLKENSVKQVVKQTWALYQKALPNVMPLSLGLGMISVGSGVLLQLLYRHYGIHPETNTLAPYTSFHPAVTLMNLGVSLLDLLGTAVLVAGVLLVMRDAYAFKRALKKGLQVFVFLVVLHLLVGMVLSVAILLILPGVFLMGKWVYAMLYIIDERQGPIQSLKRSWHLVSGYWWFSSLMLMSPIMALGMLYFCLSMLVPADVFSLFGHQRLAMAVEIGVYTVLAPFLASLYIHLAQALEQRHAQAAQPSE